MLLLQKTSFWKVGIDLVAGPSEIIVVADEKIILNGLLVI